MRKQKSSSKSTVKLFSFVLKILHSPCSRSQLSSNMLSCSSASWYSSLKHRHPSCHMKLGGCPESVRHVNAVVASSIFRVFKTAVL